MRRTTVFLTLDAETARALQARLATLFDSQVLLQRRHRPPVILVPAEDGATPAGLAGTLPAGAVLLVVASAQYEWAARAAAAPGQFAAVYVRPELLVTRDVLQDVWPAGSPDAEAWAELLALDRHLQHLPRVMMEDVHGGGTPLWPSLAEALELPWPAELTLPAPPDGAASCGRALSLLLPPRHLAASLAAARPPGTAGHIPVHAGAEGLRLLGRGWSHPEREFVWSDGASATLLLPPTPGRRLAACLHGFLIRHPGRPVSVAAWSAGTCLATAAVHPDGPGEVALDLVLPAGGREHVVELRFDAPVRPCDIGGPADARSLGLALQAVELRDAGPGEPLVAGPRAAPAIDMDAPAFLHDPLVAPLFERRRPELVLVLSAALEPGLHAARACLALGAGAVILSRAASGPAPDHPGLVPAEDADGSPIPGVALLREGLAALPALLAPERRIALAVLCDDAQTEPFLAACGTPEGTATLAGASLVVASGDPYRVGYAFCWYVHAHRLLMQSSDVVTLAGPLAA